MLLIDIDILEVIAICAVKTMSQVRHNEEMEFPLSKTLSCIFFI